LSISETQPNFAEGKGSKQCTMHNAQFFAETRPNFAEGNGSAMNK
jgi:hypothetical protein